MRCRPAFIIIRHRVALTEELIWVLQTIPAARVAARVEDARKFPVPVDGKQQMHMVFLWLAGYMLWCLVEAWRGACGLYHS